MKRNIVIALLLALLFLGGNAAPVFEPPEATAAGWYARSYSWAVSDTNNTMWRVAHYATWETTDPNRYRWSIPANSPYLIRNVKVTCWVSRSIVYNVHIDKCGNVPTWGPWPVEAGKSAHVGSLFRVCLGLGDWFNAICFGWESAVWIKGSYRYRHVRLS